MFVPSTIVELGALITDLDADTSVKVVVFQWANPDFFHRPSRRSQGSPTARDAEPLARICAAPRVHASRERRQGSRPHRNQLAHEETDRWLKSRDQLEIIRLAGFFSHH